MTTTNHPEHRDPRAGKDELSLAFAAARWVATLFKRTAPLNKTTDTLYIETGETLHAAVRADFIFKGTTLSSWCSNNSVNRQNASSALLGHWRGKTAEKLIKKITKASNATAIINTKEAAND